MWRQALRNADGQTCLRERYALATHDTPSETLTREHYRNLRYRYEDGDLFSEVTVEASPRAPDDEQVLW